MEAKEMTRLYYRARLRDPLSNIEYTEDALFLAMLAHTKGAGRTSKDMDDVLRYMLDVNVI